MITKEAIEHSLYLGMDIGAVHTRVAVVDPSGQLILTDVERIYTGPTKALKVLLDRISRKVDLDKIAGANVTGSGREVYNKDDGWVLRTSPYAAINGLLWNEPDTKTIVAMGGQSTVVIGLEDGLNKPYRYKGSTLCAAGTGRFFEQQADRLGVPIEDFGPRALAWLNMPGRKKEDIPRIAARCSVFAKSDLIHHQQAGWSVDAMLVGLADSVARMIMAQYGQPFETPVYAIGGVASNEAITYMLSQLTGTKVIVPSHHAFREAIGAALLARLATRPVSLYPSDSQEEKKTFAACLPPAVSPDGWKRTILLGSENPIKACMGVDIGSTSTKAAVILPDGELVDKEYLMTAGQPLEAAKELMRNLEPRTRNLIIRAVGITGSGRNLVGPFIHADLIKNEITAQARAAFHLDPLVDTLMELGGQDSKFVRLQNGVILDYIMNKACAAGTGSFIDELTEQLGVPTRTGEYAASAFSACEQLDLGAQCAAFMSQAVTSAQHAGIGLDVIASSLAVSLAKNYRSRVIGPRNVGEHIFLTGAVFYNDALVSAFRQEFAGKILVVPQHKEVTGAIGVALLARDVMLPDQLSSFPGFKEVAGSKYDISNFTCHHCENACQISMMRMGAGDKVYYGGRCDRWDNPQNQSQTGRVEIPTLFADRRRLLFSGLRR